MKKLLAIMLVAAIPCLAEDDYDGLQCDRGERSLCEDLTGATVRVIKSTTHQVHRQCGWNARACARLRITRDEVRCNIYVYDHDRETHIHEHNHCRGWDHDGDNYLKPWRVMPEVVQNQVYLKRSH